MRSATSGGPPLGAWEGSAGEQRLGSPHSSAVVAEDVADYYAYENEENDENYHRKS